MSQKTDTTYKFTNHLIGESSPYLLEHAHNPVNWYPWGDEAIKKARDLDLPIFLSIGYASCHWCHVMEHESFENEEIAEILNEKFVCIKVDREQRPDLDQIYMTFTQAMTGSGGWPMSVFLAPNLKPFFAGTYFPPDDRMGRPGFKYIITEISKAYEENKDQVIDSTEGIFNEIVTHMNVRGDSARLSDSMLTQGAGSLMKNFDQAYGGFGSAPKFPHATELALFLRYARKSGDISFLLAAQKALNGMARGGIYDQVGGGFARYSTDAHWLVPHFEKMLYDNALLASLYAEAFQITQEPLYLETVKGTLDFILREMTDTTGGFYSALDADSEGEEGKFYVWSKDELEQILGVDAPLFLRYYDVTEEGNFDGKNILNIAPNSDSLREQNGAKEFDLLMKRDLNKLLLARTKRVRPATDDKIVTSWNGLALSALCKGYQITGDDKYLRAARKNAEFVSTQLYPDGKLVHSYRLGVRSKGEFLEDHAYYVRGLRDLYESDPSPDNSRWLKLATALTDSAVSLFLDKDGVFYLRPQGESDLIMRPKDESDGAIPAAGSYMINNLIRLNRLTDRKEYLDKAEMALKALSGQLAKYPSSMASTLLALDYYLSDKVEVVIVGTGPERDRMLEEVYHKYIPNRIVAISGSGDKSISPLFEGRASDNGQVRAYVCRNSVCTLPASTAAELKERLREF